MRKMVSDKYYSNNWANRVRKMEDKQVVAIYYKMLENGEFDNKRIRRFNQNQQLTFSDIKRGDY
mgnify:CR=1 FL=1